MKKVSILCMSQDQDPTLSALRDLGVMHIVHVQPPQSDDLAERRAEARRAAEAAAVLTAFGKQMERKKAAAPAAAASLEPSEIVDQVMERSERKALLEDRLLSLRQEKASIEPLGDFNPRAIHTLRDKGIVVRLFHVAGKAPLVAPEGACLLPLSRDASGRYLAIAGPGDFTFHGRELVVPQRSLKDVHADIDKVRTEMDAVERALRADAAASQDAVDAWVAEMNERVKCLEAAAGMGRTEPLAYLQGFCPADRVNDLRKAGSDQGWGLLIEEPGPKDAVPTLIRNPAWIRPIRFLFDLIGVKPGYREADTSAAFLVFYSIFFAMLIGDAGYGALLLGLTAVIRFTVPRAPRDLTRLLGLLSVCTITWGVLMGTYFSLTPLPAPLASLRVDWLRDDRNLMNLCFLLGAIHLSIAHLWNAARTWRSNVAMAQFGWIAMTWTMFFVARTMILDYPQPPYLMWLFLPGLAAIVLFMTPLKAMKTEWANHIMLPLTIINNFGDVVSYVRLFAVGSASAAISIAFNEMAIGEGINSVLAGLTAALILFAAHSLNIMLCALGVIVHGVRLNTLEFCGHMGIQWTGIEYKPFARDWGAAGSAHRRPVDASGT